MSFTPRGDHRILYVSDPSSITTNLMPDPTEPDDLRRWVDTLADSGVDTFDQEVWSQGWTAYWRSETYEYDRRIHHRRYIPMLDRGIAPVQILIEQAHRRGMRFVAGFRVNDNHAYIARLQGVGIAGFIESHPELALTEFPAGSNYENTAPLDFTHQAVRDYTHGVIEEFINRFDVDGIEICMRDHGYFPPSTARAQAGLMTDLMRQVRATLDRRAAVVGRPLFMGARCYDAVDVCLNHGLDLATWIGAGLIDYVSPQDTMFTDFNLPLEPWADLTRPSDCMLYPAVQPWTSCRARERLSQIRLSSANWRALAHTSYAAGADGLSIYNDFCTMWNAPFYPYQMQIFHEVRDGDRVRAGERHYVFDPVWGGYTDFGGDGKSSTGVVNANQVRLARDGRENEGTYPFHLYEDLSRAHAATLLFRGFGMCENDELAVSVNGRPVADEGIGRTRENSAPRTEWHHMRQVGDRTVKCIQEQARIEFRTEPEASFSTRWFALDASLVRQGLNALTVRLLRSDPNATDPIVIDEVEICVMPKVG